MLSDPPDPLDEAVEGYYLATGGGKKPRQRGNLHADAGYRTHSRDGTERGLLHQIDSSKSNRKE